MAHGHKLEIFRGLVKFKSNTQKIWGVLAFLTLITAVEVVLGIIKPVSLTDTYFLGMKLINWIFIILTLVKAYYIAWDFMHLRDEKASLRRAIVWTPIFLIIYLVFILLVEADYIYNVYKDGFVSWNF
ncbi:cytochrome C oxidase subunit IV family protein [Maribacter confluentis]|uniref:Cytochrome C oxidase subunit IV family protein n=2 Tax=Maribacter TaxID=252356 RepID=A0ABT8RSK3_9FLAO|nr:MULTISPECIES: cytochrome C oxidase subunit IV family protein [Maribacter]MDO1513492.1 cytochrome C oxidase subunit IV family protein [Maribacter confluentis]MDO1514841.1 cytochrome C oxidase subunit IV family protein [Maribacter confluentis]TVZ16739.1 cytochrome c oxidase subunit IV [Maribacter sp. MAR_2009_72]SNR28877.1 Cytochrome C oxidase subunit IV [Maribacter sedimenticola]